MSKPFFPIKMSCLSENVASELKSIIASPSLKTDVFSLQQSTYSRNTMPPFVRFNDI